LRPTTLDTNLVDSSWSRFRDALLEGAPFLLATMTFFPLALRGQEATHSLRGHEGLIQLAREVWFAFGFHLRLICGLEVPAAKYLPGGKWPPNFMPEVDLMPVFFVAVIGLVTWRTASRVRKRAVGALAFALLAYLPTSNLIPLTRVLADVYVFIPLVGLGWWLAAVMDPWIERCKLPVVRALPVLALGTALMMITLPVSARWRDSIQLWGHAYSRYPHDSRLCRNLGNARFELEGPASALIQYEHCAQRFGQESFEKNIGLALVSLGDARAARPILERVLARDPEDAVVRSYLQRLGDHQP
jgi:hypothetical protein